MRAAAGLLLVCAAAALVLWLRSSAGRTSEVLDSGATTPTAAESGDELVLEHVAEIEAATKEMTRAAARPDVLSARIVDLVTREPLPGALFHARFEKGLHSADDDGCVSVPLRELPPEKRIVEFEAGADGYCVVRGSLPRSAFLADELAEIPLYAASPVRGVVLGPDGKPVVGAIVGVREAEDVDPPRSSPDGLPEGWTLAPEGIGGHVGSKEDGSFRLSGLLPRTAGYVLSVFRPGFRRVERELATAGPGTETYVEVHLERIPPPPAGKVEGLIYLNGEPVAGSVHSRSRGEAGGGPDDPFVLKLPPGTWELAAVPFECMLRKTDPFDHDWMEGNLAVLPVLDGQVTHHDFHVTAPMETIEGCVRYADGTPAREPVEALSELFCFWGETDTDGTYWFEVPVTGESYRVRIPGIVGAPVYEVEPGVSDLDFDLAPLCQVGVIAFDPEDNRAFERFSVRMRRLDGEWHHPSRTGRDPSGVTFYRCMASTLEVEVTADRRYVGRAVIEVVPGRSNRFTVAVEEKGK